MPIQTHLYRTGDPYKCLNAGIYHFPPWLEELPARGLVRRLFPGFWRAPNGAKWSTDEVRAWAREKKFTFSENYYTPNLIDTDAIEWEDRLFSEDDDGDEERRPLQFDEA